MVCSAAAASPRSEIPVRKKKKKKKKKEKPRLVAADDNWCLLGHSAFRLDLSHRLYPDPFSNASNE